MAPAARQLDTSIEVVTPENIGFHYRVAGPFRRAIAYGIDLAIRIMAVVAAFFVLLIIFGFAGLPGIGMGIGLTIYFALDWLYGGLFETFMNGQTPGKRLVQLRVISMSGQPISGWQAVLRNVLRAVDAMPTMFTLVPTYQLGFLVMLLNDRFQRLGDLACGTMVVIEEPHRLYGMVRIEEPEAVRLAGEIPANFEATRSLARALAAYVGRRQALGWARRNEIAQHLGEPLRIKFDLPPGTSHDVLLCALYLRTFIADRPESQTGSNPFQREEVILVENPVVVPTTISQRPEPSRTPAEVP